MLKKVIPLKVSVQKTKKDGTPWNYGSVAVGLELASNGEEGTTQWINGFCKPDQVPPQGCEVEIEIWKNDKGYWNWKYPSQVDRANSNVADLELRVSRLELQMSRIEGKLGLSSENSNSTAPAPQTTTTQPAPVESENVSVDDIPW